MLTYLHITSREAHECQCTGWRGRPALRTRTGSLGDQLPATLAGQPIDHQDPVDLNHRFKLYVGPGKSLQKLEQAETLRLCSLGAVGVTEYGT